MKDDDNSFRTRKGTRFYKRSRMVGNKRVYAEHFTLRAKQVTSGSVSQAYFNLGSSKREAGELADKITAFLAVEGNTLAEALTRYSEPHRNRELRKAKAPAPTPAVLTVGALITEFLAVTHHLSPVTRRNNTAALRHFAAGLIGLEKLGINQTKKQQQEWRVKVDAFPVDGFLTLDLEKFRQREIAGCAGDHLQIGKTSTTLNSYLRAARGVFSKKLLPLYSHLTLPNPLPFRDLAPLPEPSHRYKSEIDAVALIELAKTTLYRSDAPAWIAFILCIGAGLRREELDKLEWAQVDLQERRIWIRTTEFFRPKAKNSEAYIDISEGVAAYLAEYRATPECKTAQFVLPGRTVAGKLRSRKVLATLMKWLRKQGVPARTPLHTLRKEAGSLVFKSAGSIDQAAEFLRNDPRVAREHYIGRKERIELVIPGL